ncbi:hypothetical protein [Klebsiella pneumoniae]|uniref:hypothetical protein n=1 Tax=Klebsiella pneumoniae TaxID=573 RepID=UPI00188944F5|nr:hypothetical protein [Klebsiella pneumoniae]
MTTIINKDSLRQQVEAASGGKRTVLYTAKGQACFMNIIEKFDMSTIDPSWSGTHPAFIIGGVEKSQIYVGTYQGVISDGELISAPYLAPSALGIYATLHDTARLNGAGWHAMTGAEWAAIALLALNKGALPRGNTNYGQSAENSAYKGARVDGLAPGTVSGTALTYGGSGPASWRHDRLYAGVSDIVGNAWEVPYGVRFMYGEIQILDNAAVNLSTADYDNWKAVDRTTGALITPTYTGTIAGGDYVPTTDSVRIGHATLPSIFPYNNNFAELSTIRGTISAAALNTLRQYGLYVKNATLQVGEFSYGTTGINIPVRGGDYKMTATTGNNSPGLFAANGRVLRDTTYRNLYAARPCFYS